MKEILSCCEVEYSTTDNEEKIDCFKSNRFFKKFTVDRVHIRKEIVLVTFCMNCCHYIIKYLWYNKESANFFDYVDSKIIRGKKADEIFANRSEDWEFYELPKTEIKQFTKHSKKIPWIYYKSVNNEQQVPRYMDETDNAGRKVFTPLKVTKL